MLIRSYTAEDSSKISQFMKQNFVKDIPFRARSSDAEYYRWKYGENCAGKPIVRVAEENGEIVGLMCAVPRLLWVNEKVYFGAESGDTFIHPDYRGKHLFLDIAREVFQACQEAGMAFICGVPNPASFPVMTGIFDYKVLFEYRSMVRPLRFTSIIRKKIRSRVLSAIVGTPVSLAFGLLFSVPFCRGRITFERLTALDDRMDAIWEKNKKGYTFSFVKNRAYLDWRFMKNPEAFDVYVVHERQEPVGYVVIKMTNMLGFRFALIADLLLPQGNRRLLIRCLRGLEIMCRRQAADFLAHWAMLESRTYAILKRMGFFVRKKKFWYILRDEEGVLSRLGDLSDRRRWTFSQADSDNV